MLEGLNIEDHWPTPCRNSAVRDPSADFVCRLGLRPDPRTRESALAGASKKSYRRQMFGMIDAAPTANPIERGSGLSASARLKEGRT